MATRAASLSQNSFSNCMLCTVCLATSNFNVTTISNAQWRKRAYHDVCSSRATFVFNKVHRARCTQFLLFQAVVHQKSFCGPQVEKPFPRVLCVRIGLLIDWLIGLLFHMTHLISRNNIKSHRTIRKPIVSEY